jgi:hypothetical protein
MLYILLSVTIFIFVVFTHIQWCRASLIRDLQITPFIVYSVSGLALYFTIIGVFFFQPLVPDPVLWILPLKATAVTLYICLSVLYLMFYFGTNVESPSRILLVLIEEADGMTENELLEHFTNDYLICPRFEDLLRTGYLEFDGTAYRLSRRGLIAAKLLDFYQKLIGRPMGG